MLTSTTNRTKAQNIGLVLAFLVLGIILALPSPDTLSTGGHRMIGILAFAIILWMSSAVSYPVSATIITALTALLLGFAPNPEAPAKLYGTSNALKLIISGFSSPAMVLVGAAMFISVAMRKTGLDRRIALNVLSAVGTKVSRIYIGVIITGFILAFFVPSATARLACLAPIIIGIVESLGINKKSQVAALLMVGATQADTFWNIMIQTAAAQNLVAVGFIQTQMNTTIPWIDWLLAAAPYSMLMVAILYFVTQALIKPEFKELKGGDVHIANMRREMGPMSLNEKKLLVISIGLLFLWATGGKLHTIDTTTTTIIAIALFFFPGIGIMDWKFAQPNIDWGSIVMFGAGIGLGSVLLKTKAATWLAHVFVSAFSLETASIFLLIAIMAAFLIVIHLGFASATALSSAMIPIVISIVMGHDADGLNPLGVTMLMQYAICFGLVLPVNSPQGMVAYGTDAFDVKTFMRTGIPMTIIGYLMMLVFTLTYWHWIGLS
ncbi:DASS family sodium-coupled anion symporter [Veillonella caviae]|uniref:DASS family sodium-coupled anion symporter n=2 Tax=Veillonella caviae TaxID=248316 RepID=UPI0023F3B62F|nr:DASS family sodium-coupled anion symporter [Veillonella caviae]MCI6406701.1 anion permease [Veillonella caviae]MDY6224545.1 DASS family sodium-coupled anion symporter [Veillonella caviae]